MQLQAHGGSQKSQAARAKPQRAARRNQEQVKQNGKRKFDGVVLDGAGQNEQERGNRQARPASTQAQVGPKASQEKGQGKQLCIVDADVGRIVRRNREHGQAEETRQQRRSPPGGKPADNSRNQQATDAKREQREHALGEEIVVGPAVQLSCQHKRQHGVVDNGPASLLRIELQVGRCSRGVIYVPAFDPVQFHAVEGACEGNDGGEQREAEAAGQRPITGRGERLAFAWQRSSGNTWLLERSYRGNWMPPLENLRSRNPRKSSTTSTRTMESCDELNVNCQKRQTRRAADRGLTAC